MTTAADVAVAFSTFGDGPAIDFVNTADWHAAPEPTELLTTYDRLIDWAGVAGLLDPVSSSRLLATAAKLPDRAAATLAGAIDLRETLYRIFSAAGRGVPAADADLSALNGRLSFAYRRLGIRPADNGPLYRWATHPDDDLGWFLAPVVQAAVELLVSPGSRYIRECAGHPCGWIFLDHSRNHSRRWCSMAGCGNRAKARRHYERSKATR